MSPGTEGCWLPDEIGRRLTNALAYTGRTESTILLEELEILDAELLQEEEAGAKAEAEMDRGLTMFTDGSRLDSGAAGYAVVWKNGQTWKGIKTHMGYNQEAYDAECAALVHALESASRNTTPERVTIFTDAQAAIRRMASEELGPGQQYALQARKHIATLRRARPGITIEIRWCPAHKGIAGNQTADEWAKVAAEKPDTHGGGTSILFRIYKPVQNYGEDQQRHQPSSVRESSYAAIPLALLALSPPTLLLQIATISRSLYQSHFPLQHLVICSTDPSLPSSHSSSLGFRPTLAVSRNVRIASVQRSSAKRSAIRNRSRPRFVCTLTSFQSTFCCRRHAVQTLNRCSSVCVAPGW